jgi:hypothetical protein
MKWTLRPIGAWPSAWRTAWSTLCADQHAEHPLLDLDFVDAALAHYPPARGWVAACEEAAGITALAVIDGSARFSAQLHRPEQAPLPFCVIRNDARAGERFAALARALPLPRLLLTLPAQDTDFGGLDAPRAGALGGRTVPYGTTIRANLGEGFEAYWAARSKKLRDNIGRYHRRAAKDGHAVRLEHLIAPETMAGAVADYGAIESAGWKGREGTAIHADNAQGRFYIELMQRFAARGRAHAFRLWFGDRIVAARLALTAPDMLVFLKTTYDEQYSQYAAGRLLLHATLEAIATRSPARRVEFYTKANADMLEWASAQRDITHVDLYRSPAARSAVELARRAAAGFGQRASGNGQKKKPVGDSDSPARSP